MILSQANSQKVESKGDHTGVQVNFKHVAFSADSFCFLSQGWTGNSVSPGSASNVGGTENKEGGTSQLTQMTHTW